MSEENHVHDCTGHGMRCPCGYVLTVPPISVEISVFDRDRELVNACFNYSDLWGAIDALRDAADKLERDDEA